MHHPVIEAEGRFALSLTTPTFVPRFAATHTEHREFDASDVLDPFGGDGDRTSWGTFFLTIVAPRRGSANTKGRRQ